MPCTLTQKTCLVDELWVERSALAVRKGLDVGILLDDPVLLLEPVQKLPEGPDDFVNLHSCAPHNLYDLTRVIVLRCREGCRWYFASWLGSASEMTRHLTTAHDIITSPPGSLWQITNSTKD